MALRRGYLLFAVAGITLLTAAVTPATAADLVLKRVVLSTGGVGYFEYAAPVEGDATLTLDVPLDQVDDVLKSLVVYDGNGSAGEITLPGREPLTQSFADLPIDRQALQSEVALLNALQGAEIRIAAPKAISGRLVHVDQERIAGPGGTGETRAWVGVMTAQGLQRVALNDVDAVAFVDPRLQNQIDTALQRIAAYRDSGRRKLTLTVHGTGARTVRVGYVVAAPLWKPTYRLTVPAGAEIKSARLQGWAVLENFSGVAWQGVELTLLSGNPVTFRQALYESYYVPRPVVPVESGTRVLPPPDTGTVAAAAKTTPGGPQTFRALQAPAGAAMAAPAPAAPPPAPIEGASAAEQATQVSFTAPFKVDAAAGQSLVLPLLDRALPAKRIDLYQPTVDSRHPLAAIELTNDSGIGLPPGVLTLYQQGDAQAAIYLGDARLAALPAGDKRLLSYAVDGKATIDRSATEQQPVVKATIAQGVLRINRMVRSATIYHVKTAGAAAPTALLEQPRIPGATLVAPASKNLEMTANAYRIPLALPAAGETELTVVEQRPVEDTVGLLDIADDRLAALVTSTELDAKTHAALSDLAARRQAVAQQQAELDRVKAQHAQLVNDETRLRANLGALLSDPTLHKRELDKFDQTETAIDAASAAISKGEDALAAARHDLSAYIAGLKL